MLSTKKAQGMSLNTVIIAIVVLIVLVVLIMIFTGYFGKVFTPSVSSCATQGGSCMEPAACQDSFGQPGRSIVTKDCKDTSAATKPTGASATAVCCLRGQ